MAIVLAAGEARRMGTTKALLPWRGESLLRHCVRTARASRCDEVLVVLGADADLLEPEIADLDVESFRHERWRDGMGSTLAAAMRHLPRETVGVVVLLCDQPFVTPDLLDRLVESAGDGAMSACAYDGTIGPPAYFGESQFARLRALSGEHGAKSLLLDARDAVATLPFPRGAFDIDEPDDYDRAVEELERDSTREGDE